MARETTKVKAMENTAQHTRRNELPTPRHRWLTLWIFLSVFYSLKVKKKKYLFSSSTFYSLLLFFFFLSLLFNSLTFLSILIQYIKLDSIVSTTAFYKFWVSFIFFLAFILFCFCNVVKQRNKIISPILISFLLLSKPETISTSDSMIIIYHQTAIYS